MLRHFKRAMLVAVVSFAVVTVAGAEHAEREGVAPEVQHLPLTAPSTSGPPCIPAQALIAYPDTVQTICKTNGHYIGHQPVAGWTPPPPPQPLQR